MTSVALGSRLPLASARSFSELPWAEEAKLLVGESLRLCSLAELFSDGYGLCVPGSLMRW